MSTALELDQRSNDSNGNDENGLDDRVRKQTTITAIGKVGQPCISNVSINDAIFNTSSLKLTVFSEMILVC